MPYIGFERVTAQNIIGTVDKLTVPNETHWVEIQADTQNVRYTMDGSTEPTETSGMLFLTTEPPKLFLVKDVKNIKYIKVAAGDGFLNLHYGAGRDV